MLAQNTTEIIEHSYLCWDTIPSLCHFILTSGRQIMKQAVQGVVSDDALANVEVSANRPTKSTIFFHNSDRGISASMNVSRCLNAEK